MNVKIGNIAFDQASYDAEGDVLYLHVGDPRVAADVEETPEGHALRLDENGVIIGLTLVNARWLLERDGAVTVTLPDPHRVGAEELAEALAVA